MNALLALVEQMFDCVWKTSASAAVLAALVFLTQKLLGRWLRPRLRYVLSLLVFIRLMIPVVPSSPLSLENFFRGSPLTKRAAASWAAPDAEVRRPRRAANALSVTPDKPLAVTAVNNFRFASAPPAAPLSARDWMGIIWVSGCICLVVSSCWGYRRWNRLIGCGRGIADPQLLKMLDDARRTMGVRRSVKVIAVARLNSPAVFGLRRIRLLLPEGALGQLSAGELRLIFLHEMAHVRRRDDALNVLLMAVQFVHWFNPLAWLASHRIRADGELVCDEMVMNNLQPAERPAYGRVLLRLIEEFVAEAPAFPGAIRVVSSKEEIKRRLIMIKHHRHGTFGSRLATALAVAALVCGTFTRAQNTAGTAGIVNLESSAGNSSSDANKSDGSRTTSPSQLARDLIGTWVLVGRPGDTAKAPASGGRYRFFTGSRWCITQADPDNHIVLFHHGGAYWFDGNGWVETIEFANPTTMDRIGRTNHLQIKIEGDTLTDFGVGKDTSWSEVWKRVGGKGDLISRSQLGQELIGAWTRVDEPDAFKFITDSSWCDITLDRKTGVVIFHHGGTCTLKGNRYVESVEYANPITMNLIGHSFKFDVKMDGDTLRDNGIGNPWHESWTRVR